MTREILTIKQASLQSGIAIQTIHRLIDEDRLDVYRIQGAPTVGRGSTLYLTSDAVEWLRSRTWQKRRRLPVDKGTQDADTPMPSK